MLTEGGVAVKAAGLQAAGHGRAGARPSYHRRVMERPGRWTQRFMKLILPFGVFSLAVVLVGTAYSFATGDLASGNTRRDLFTLVWIAVLIVNSLFSIYLGWQWRRHGSSGVTADDESRDRPRPQ